MLPAVAGSSPVTHHLDPLLTLRRSQSGRYGARPVECLWLYGHWPAAGPPLRSTMTVDPQDALDQPFVRASAAELNRLLTTLEVKVVWLSECLVSPGWRLDLPRHASLGIHYSLMGDGWLK